MESVDDFRIEKNIVYLYEGGDQRSKYYFPKKKICS